MQFRVSVCVRVAEVNEDWRERDCNTTDVRFQDPIILLVIANLHNIATFILSVLLSVNLVQRHIQYTNSMDFALAGG